MSHSLTSKIESANSTLLTQGHLEAVGEFFSPNYVAHVTGEDKVLDHDGIRSVLAMYRRAFPDLTVEVEILLVGENRVAWQRTHRGTHQAAFKGFPGSGQTIVWRDVVISGFRDGLIAEEWVISDLAERLLLSRKR